MLQNYFFDLKETTIAIVNPDLKKLLPDGEVNTEYLEDLLWRAKKGLFVYDNTLPCNWSNTKYHLVARPERPLKLKDLPTHIANLLPQTTHPITWDNVIDISLIEGL